ncbi:MAG: acyl carrier protein [Lentisphaerae bacterium RIFOXYB12_FULL_65_16]|nr:MAG: acyl carrier protein [Lentisphaerae bacterium RIFOXYA12_64_32]OGV90017.1 MAG: acyl carrier protein [Lentisphaerae bacterium RIFOXYB12_FULL_65_16]
MTTKEQLKQILVSDLNLEDMTPEQIPDDSPLFGQGLGLDSLDAVELVVIVQRHFGVEIKDMQEARSAFQTVETLATLIDERRPTT